MLKEHADIPFTPPCYLIRWNEEADLKYDWNDNVLGALFSSRAANSEMWLQYLCPVISPSSDSDDKESESDSDSGNENKHSKEDGHDHRANDITHNE